MMETLLIYVTLPQQGASKFSFASRMEAMNWPFRIHQAAQSQNYAFDTFVVGPNKFCDTRPPSGSENISCNQICFWKQTSALIYGRFLFSEILNLTDNRPSKKTSVVEHPRGAAARENRINVTAKSPSASGSGQLAFMGERRESRKEEIRLPK